MAKGGIVGHNPVKAMKIARNKANKKKQGKVAKKK